jgi:aminoglycoside 3-N-acetyltransferase I
MAEVFGQGCESLSDDYVDRILAREDFWAIAACVDDLIVGGLNAHTCARVILRGQKRETQNS